MILDVLVRSFSYTPRADFSEEFQSLTFLMRGGLVRSFSYTPRAGLVRSFSYTPRAGFNEEFLLHS